ncbi:PREDICTED: eye-specific diacylglycerol kinase [Rhagoletis zephyria]|uniref:eye-specific diacylglycerol kinase n=2 Tax=Rhagoletis zephyria TaxID=28612 RepID=UPI00081126CB|nr:PREDICTED: eye-specific diacylglycerol kinase [Rhagoletis zephyria]
MFISYMNCECDSESSHSDTMSVEQLLLAVREETESEDDDDDDDDDDDSNEDGGNDANGSCREADGGSETESSHTVDSTTSGAPLLRRFRRSSIGMQRKAAFRQRKLDSLGTWRKRRSASASNARRPIRIVPDWTENAVQGEHFWKPTSVSGDLCCLNEECIKSGQRMKCSACQLIAHQNCIPIVNEKTQLACKPTYRDVGVRQYREQSTTHHHWVHRKMEKGKCKQCGKAVQGKLFGSKEIVALSCAWCHEVYHNKESCFNQAKIGEECSLGNYAPIIVPPSWIVKLPTKGNFKSSIRVNNKSNVTIGTSKKKGTSKRQKQKEEKKEPRAFIVKPIPSPDVIPVIVFINPKSGGNQGVKLLGKFQHLLNPRQVFDLTQGGPKMGLELFRKAPNLRVLACGGDGTVGWVLSVLDMINPQQQLQSLSHKLHTFFNYGGGTHPWNDSFGQSKPAIDDGMIEVVGLTTYQLPMLQAGLHGTCICQCRSARIITKKTIPMQVDGEACRVKPSIIEMSLLNKAVMLAKRKHGRGDVQVNPLEKLHLTILRITMQQYEQHHYDKEMLRKLANKLGKMEIESQCDLEQVRNILNAKFEESITYPKVSQDWCFIDSCTAEHYFRIDRAQEHLHYICDIAIDELYILDHEAATMPQTPDQERSFSAYSQRIGAQNERRSMDPQGRSGSTEDDLQIGKPVKVMKWKSNKDRLFSFNEDVFGYGFSPILEQTSDAVLLAAHQGDLNMLRALHEQGYSLQSVNKNGQTALHFACKYDHKDIVRYIISCASRRLINLADKDRGQTALHVAAENNRRDLCVMLVAAGANLQASDLCGNTPMMVAFNKNFTEIATYLESKMFCATIHTTTTIAKRRNKIQQQNP